MIAVSWLCALPAKALIRRLLRIALSECAPIDGGRALGEGADGRALAHLLWRLKMRRKKFKGMPHPTATVDLVTMVRSDYYVLAGMHRASAAVSSCLDLAGGNVPFWTTQAQRRGGLSRPSRFRLFHHEPSAPAVGVRPDRKLGPEEQSHKSLTLGVCAAGNVG